MCCKTYREDLEGIVIIHNFADGCIELCLLNFLFLEAFLLYPVTKNRQILIVGIKQS